MITRLKSGTPPTNRDLIWTCFKWDAWITLQAKYNFHKIPDCSYDTLFLENNSWILIKISQNKVKIGQNNKNQHF